MGPRFTRRRKREIFTGNKATGPSSQGKGPEYSWGGGGGGEGRGGVEGKGGEGGKRGEERRAERRGKCVGTPNNE